MPIITIRAESDPTLSFSRLIPLGQNTALRREDLGSIASNVGSVEYGGRDRNRIYLFNQAIGEGFSNHDYLLFPLLRADEPQRVVEVGPFDPNKWQSARVYDIGLCSQTLDYQAVADTFGVAVRDTWLDNERVRGGSVPQFSLDVLFKQTRAFGPNDDLLGVAFELRAQAIRGPLGGQVLDCEDVTLFVSAGISLRRVAPGRESTPARECGEGEPSASYPIRADGYTFDFEGVVENYQALISVGGGPSACLTEIPRIVEEELREAFRTQIQPIIRSQLLFAPSDIFLPGARPCTCQRDCAPVGPMGSPYPGQRHFCDYDGGPPVPGRGVCNFQIEADRIELRPEGLEIVLVDDEDDPQLPAFRSSGLLLTCAGSRAPSVGSRETRPAERSTAFPFFAALDE